MRYFFNQSRRRLLLWFWRLPVLMMLAGAGYGLRLAFRHTRKPAANPNPDFEVIPAVDIASLNTLTAVWQSIPFRAVNHPAILIRVPHRVVGGLTIAEGNYLALSRICTHQGCLVQLQSNLETIAMAYNYRSDEPVLVCPCHFSIFSPSRAGQAMSGPAIRPLPRFKLALQAGRFQAVAIETNQGVNDG